jgi:predicted Rossmann fold nucleotide-binding protein DprA/Smf involved in DNA uptake
VKLGNPNAAEAVSLGIAAIRASTEKFAANVQPIVESLQAAGITIIAGIADALSPFANGSGSASQFRGCRRKGRSVALARNGADAIKSRCGPGSAGSMRRC